MFTIEELRAIHEALTYQTEVYWEYLEPSVLEKYAAIEQKVRHLIDSTDSTEVKSLTE
jgi:hypothetical protein